MVTIRTCKVFSHALGEYLRQADYYSQGMKVEGRCFGRLCAKAGLNDDEIYKLARGNAISAFGLERFGITA